MPANLAPPPTYWMERDQLTHDVTDAITADTRQWLLSVTGRVQQSPLVLAAVALTTQAAAIGATAIPLGALAPGTYRVTYYARITQAATVSSSLTVTLQWTDGGIGQTATFPAMTGNTTATSQTNVILVNIDQGTSLTYSTAYASVGATAMQYALTVVPEQLR